jgi:hypothetical protein
MAQPFIIGCAGTANGKRLFAGATATNIKPNPVFLPTSRTEIITFQCD